jgi:hypothetical protein
MTDASSDARNNSDDPVEAYLDELLVSLPGSPRDVRHLLTEVEGHLYDLVDAGRRAGLDETAARAEAVRRIGPVDGIRPRRRYVRWTPAVRRRLVLAALLIGGFGGVAVGLAGMLAAVTRSIWGDWAIAVMFPTGSYTAADCARWTRLYPGRSCLQAMAADHANDFLLVTAGLGVLGLLALALHALLERRWNSRALALAFPTGTEETAGAILAGLAAIGYAGQGLDEVLVTYGRGAGQPFSLAIAATMAAVVLAILARRARRRPLRTPSTRRDTPS